MEHLWAPWRNAYVTKKEPTPADLFTQLAASSNDAEDFILARSKCSFAVLNRYPYNAGHTMVVPYREVADLDELGDDEILDLMNLVKKVKTAMTATMRPQGFNLGINVGEAAGAGVAAHLHVHIVPRWSNDANFMTTTSGCRIHPSDLPKVYELLKEKL